MGLMVMIRPRAGGFCFTGAELAAMAAEIDSAADAIRAAGLPEMLADRLYIGQ